MNDNSLTPRKPTFYEKIFDAPEPVVPDATLLKLIDRAKRAVLREVTAEQGAAGRARHRADPSARLRYDRLEDLPPRQLPPEILSKLGEQIGIALSANCCLPTQYRPVDRVVVAERTQVLADTEARMRDLLRARHYPACAIEWTPEFRRVVLQGKPGPGMA